MSSVMLKVLEKSAMDVLRRKSCCDCTFLHIFNHWVAAHLGSQIIRR